MPPREITHAHHAIDTAVALAPTRRALPQPWRTDHPSAVHARPGRWAQVLGVIAVVATLAAWVVVIADTVGRISAARATHSAGWLDVGLLVAVTAVTLLLGFSSLTYLVARHGALRRLRRHRRATRRELDVHFADHEPTMTVLVPSYAEEPRVVRATLWSAALQEFPSLDIVLLLDDRPFPTDPAVLAKLEETRGIPLAIEAALQRPREICAQALGDALRRRAAATDPQAEVVSAAEVAELYDRAAAWLGDMAAGEQVVDHADEFFVDEVILGLARDLAQVATRLRARRGPLPATEGLARLRRLLRIFDARLDVFERKRFASLSHEANKAMNLNSYISLMGRSWSVQPVVTADGMVDVLRSAMPGEPLALHIPDADYVLTLDADSLLVPDYCLRLVHVMEQPGHERMAVIQTPYSSYRGAPAAIERVAGMTTDLQHLQHQGKTAFDATFWVGANAIIRRRALDDIVEVATERGAAGPIEVRRYIQDRTVIEDTESSMDLVANGWSLYNYPERLSFSATPPDFGSLVVQRRRWANGGLIILPKVAQTVWRRLTRGERTTAGEIALRSDYLGSIAWSTFGTLFLLVIPGVGSLLTPWLALTALPYFVVMSLDLKRSGHRIIDVLSVFALNLVLLPVNAAGVIKSVEQGITKRKIPFARTPKVADRVAAPAMFVVVPYVMGVVVLALAVVAGLRGHWAGVAFASVTGVATLIGAVVFVGTRTAVEDVAAALRQRR